VVSGRGAAAAIALAIAMAAAPAYAGSPTLDEAQQAIDAVDYETAAKLVAHALDEGELGATDFLLAHRLAGEIAAALGDTDAAREHFTIWILLDPHASLSAGASPKLTEPFADAERQVSELGTMSIEAHAERDGDTVRVTLDVRDPLALIGGMRVEGGGQVAAGRGTEVELTLGEDVTELEVTVLSAHNDAIAVRTVTLAGATAERPERHEEGPATRGGWPVFVRWPTWTALAVVGLGTGGYFAWQVGKDHDELDALNADSANHTFDEALALEERGKKHALYADISFGVGGAFAIAAIVALVLEPDRVEVTPVASSDGAGLSASLRF
jgi:hypothetical protein